MSTTFDESLARFQQFLETNGFPGKVVWITPNDLIVTGKLVYVYQSAGQLRKRGSGTAFI